MALGVAVACTGGIGIVFSLGLFLLTHLDDFKPNFREYEDDRD